MQRGYAPEWVLSGSYLIRGSDPKTVMEGLNSLRVDTWKSHLVTQDVSVVPGGAFTQTEKWYGTEYHVENVSPALLEVSLSVSNMRMSQDDDFIRKENINRPLDLDDDRN